jgi:SpoIID/LytB domain protein
MDKPQVTVGLVTREKIKFTLHGDFACSAADGTRSGKYVATVEDGTVAIEGDRGKETFKEGVVFEPSNFDAEHFTVENVIIGVNFHWRREEKQDFRGTLSFIVENGALTAVNELPIEEYLASVISSEMSARSNMPLLKAHAVISRSWLVAQMRKSERLKSGGGTYETIQRSDDELIRWYDREDHTRFDVCADDHCQRYQGVTKIYSDRAVRAVRETEGLALVSGEEICDARFSKSCGGVTEAFENVWEDVRYPYLVSVADYKYEPDEFSLHFRNEAHAEKWIRESPPAFCNTSNKEVLSQVLLQFDQETTDFYRWRVEYEQKELAALIAKKTGEDFGEILDLIPVERGESSRLVKLKIVGTKKTLTIGKELEIRRALSESHLYSSAFVVDKKNAVNGVPQRFELIGAGWGHGVGLCQIGAAVMGEMGYQFDEILLHYYRGAELKKIY